MPHIKERSDQSGCAVFLPTYGCAADLADRGLDHGQPHYMVFNASLMPRWLSRSALMSPMPLTIRCAALASLMMIP